MSRFAATALTATSIGVSVGMWRRHGALRTPKGELLTHVAEMDDLSGIALMALLFSVLPVIRSGAAGGGDLWAALLVSGGVFALKLVLFAGLCFSFARYGERHVTGSFQRLGSAPELMVLVAGVGIVIAGTAALLGLSVAIGALMAGAVPPGLYAAVVLVSAVTCLLAPVTLEILFRRWPEELGEDED